MLIELVVAAAMVLVTVVIQGFEIGSTGLCQALGAVRDLLAAVHFSTITYSTIGYSDAAILPEWPLVGAIEGINGILLLVRPPPSSCG